MAPPKAIKKAAKPQKKEKLFHPQSRKADQVVRAQLRKSKLVDLTKARKEKRGMQLDIYSFFYAAIPAEGVLTLQDLHAIVRDIWLTRYDAELEEEKAARRKGRPKSVKEQKLEELKRREVDEYRTGLEVIDLTHPKNVELFRRWNQKEAPYVQQLRYIRVSSTNPDTFTVSRIGHHPSLKPASAETSETVSIQEDAMDEDDVPLLLEPTSRFSSTIMTMDEVS